MLNNDQNQLNEWRREIVTKTIERFNDKPSIYICKNNSSKGPAYYRSGNTSETLTIPCGAGAYVFYSKKNNRPIYVGESGDLRRRLRYHCSKNGKSTLRRKWVRTWIGEDSTEDEVVEFIHSKMYIKYLVFPFGRKEIEEDLQKLWNIEKPQSISIEDF